MTLEDIIIYSVSLLSLILFLGFLCAITGEYFEKRRLKQTLQVPPLPSPPPSHRQTIPHSHSISSLSDVYMEDGILNVRFSNPRTVPITTSSRDWSNPSAFFDRPPHQTNFVYNMYDFPSFYGLTIEQIEKVAPTKLHVKQPNDEKVICVICMDHLQPGQKRKDLPCGHSFHAKCILIWLQKANRCPCCTAEVVPRDSTDDLPVLNIEPSEPRRIFGFRELARSTFGERRDHRPRFLGLWSFSNRRVTRVQPTRRSFWDDRAIRAEERNRILDNNHTAHRAYINTTLRNGRTPTEMSTTVSERQTGSLNGEEVDTFLEIREIDSTQTDAEINASSPSQ